MLADNIIQLNCLVSIILEYRFYSFQHIYSIKPAIENIKRHEDSHVFFALHMLFSGFLLLLLGRLVVIAGVIFGRLVALTILGSFRFRRLSIMIAVISVGSIISIVHTWIWR